MPDFNTMTEEARQQFVIDLKEGRDADISELRAACKKLVDEATVALGEANAAKAAAEDELAAATAALATANARIAVLEDALDPARVAARVAQAHIRARAAAKLAAAGLTPEEAEAVGIA